MPYNIIGKWFGWYWDKRDLILLAKVLKEGVKHTRLNSRDSEKLNSITRRIKKLAAKDEYVGGG
jgi:hypothetical protein